MLVSLLSIVRLSVRIHLHLLVVLSGWRSRGLFTAHGVIWLCLLLWERIQWRIKTVFALGRMLQHLLFLLAVFITLLIACSQGFFFGDSFGRKPVCEFLCNIVFLGVPKSWSVFRCFFMSALGLLYAVSYPCSCSREYIHIYSSLVREPEVSGCPETALSSLVKNAFFS